MGKRNQISTENGDLKSNVSAVSIFSTSPTNIPYSFFFVLSVFPPTMTEIPGAKRHKPNVPENPAVGSALKKKQPKVPGPDYEKGLEYWDNVEASVDGVLGGFGTGVSHIFKLE